MRTKRELFRRIFYILVACFLCVSCEKEAGEGGDAILYGKVFAKKYNSTFTQYISSYYAADEYVYIIYGNDMSYGDRVKTGYDGVFEFKYLYPGNYKIYVYSRDSTFSSPSGDIAVVKEIQINGRKEKKDSGQLDIFQ